jgi:hypothetical protein
MTSEEQIYQEFAVLAQAYCLALEELPVTGKNALSAIRNALLPLYTAALALPEASGAQFNDIPTQPHLLEVQKARVLAQLKTALPVDIYWQVYHPFTERSEEPVCGSLFDDLLDVWLDLKPGLEVLSTSPESWSADVYWDWKFNFETHWGTHAIDALSVIHKWLRDI